MKSSWRLKSDVEYYLQQASRIFTTRKNVLLVPISIKSSLLNKKGLEHTLGKNFLQLFSNKSLKLNNFWNIPCHDLVVKAPF